MLTQLLDSFFDTINIWYPILQYSSIAVLLEACEQLSDEDETLLHAITTASLRFLPSDVVCENERKRQRDVSIRRVKLFVLEHMSLRTLQALVILSIDAFGTDRMPGLLALIRRQFDMLSVPRDYSSPRPEHSSPASIFDERSFDTSMVDAESLESLGHVIGLLEQFCYLTTVARSQGSFSQADAPPPSSTPQLATAIPNMTLDIKYPSFGNNGVPAPAPAALEVLSHVFTFAQISFATPQAAAQKQWRLAYAGLHRALTRGGKRERRPSKSKFAVCEEVGSDENTAAAIHLSYVANSPLSVSN